MKNFAIILAILIACSVLPNLVGTVAPSMVELPTIHQIIIYQLIALGPAALYCITKYVDWPSNLIISQFKGLSCLYFLFGTVLLSYASGILAISFIEKSIDKAGLLSSYPISTIFSGVILAPVLEELIFRKGIVDSLNSAIPTNWCVIVATCMFAFFHGINPMSIALLGLSYGLTYTYVKTNIILYPIIIHSFFNLLSFTFSNSKNTNTSTTEVSNPLFIVAIIIVAVILAIVGRQLLSKGYRKYDEV